MMAGLSYAHFTQYGYLRTTLAGDPWITATAFWIWPGCIVYTNGGLTVTPGIGVQWNSENQTNTIIAYRAKSPLAAVSWL